jgi:sugar lactone lactonase YvrE
MSRMQNKGTMLLHAIAYTLGFGTLAMNAQPTMEEVAGAPKVALATPTDISFDSSGALYICEHKGHRIARIAPDGAITTLGNGQLRSPLAVIATEKHGIVVADTQNHRVVTIDPNTNELRILAGPPEHQYQGVFDIYLGPSRPEVFFIDLGGKRIHAVNLDDRAVRTVIKTGEGSDPRAIAMDSKGTLYVLDRHGNALRRTTNGRTLETLIDKGLNGPKHLAIDSQDRVIIADSENHRILRYDPKRNQTLTIAGSGSAGASLDQLRRPSGVAIGPNGYLYIADSYNNRVLRMPLPE